MRIIIVSDISNNQIIPEYKYIKIDSNIINNYKFFYDKIASNKLLPHQLYETFQKLTIVLIN
jgi:hypothetical protein